MEQPTQLKFQRFEFKYHLPAHLVPLIKEDLFSHRMKWDPYVSDNEKKSYTVTSLYFDNAAWSCYYDKEAGLEERAKLRFRIYKPRLSGNDTIFLEIKQRHDAVTSKKRVVIPQEAYFKFLETRRLSSMLPFIGEVSRNAFRDILAFGEFNCLYPRILVQYLREPLIWEFNDRLRITFDHDIKMAGSNKLEAGSMLNVLRRNVIMEVKYNSVLPHWFPKIIRKYELQREPYSKYGRSVESFQRYKSLQFA